MSEPAKPAITASPVPGHVLVTDATGKSISFAPSLVSTIEQMGAGSTIVTFAGHAITVLLDFQTVIDAIATAIKDAIAPAPAPESGGAS